MCVCGGGKRLREGRKVGEAMIMWLEYGCDYEYMCSKCVCIYVVCVYSVYMYVVLISYL